ncbi:hypothetical protein JCM3765_002443 [Sporobolomyces pararoseus]
MAATQSLAISSSHSDLITSLLFSPQSTHLATCSLDSQIRIVQRNTSTGLYDQNQVIFKAHDGPVLSLSWSKPQFGLILASGGVDGTIKIWKQPDQSQLLSHHHNHNKSRHGSTRHSNQNWILCTTFTEPRGTIRSLEFSPSEFGLKLASISSDSRLRIWECIDPIKVNDFNLVQEIDLNLLPLSFPSSSSSTMMTGGGGTNYSTSTSGGNSSGVSVVNSNGNTSNENASTNGSVTGSSSIDGSRRIGVSQSTVESDGGWSLSWCREHWWGETLAVSSGSNGLIRLFHFPSSNSSSSLSSTTGSNSISNSNNSWINFLNLYPTRQTLSSSSITSPTDSSSIPPPPPVPNHLPPTSSLNWAPPSGRSFQLLAAGSKDSKVRVYKIFPPSLQGPGSSSSSSSSNYHHQHHDQGGGGGEWTAQLDVELDESIHYNNNNNNSSSSGMGGGVNNPPGGGGGTSPSNNNNIANGIGSTKVEWNVTGTVLSTSGGEDGKVRLWKSTYTGQWRQITSLNTEVSPLSVVEGTMDH